MAPEQQFLATAGVLLKIAPQPVAKRGPGFLSYYIHPKSRTSGRQQHTLAIVALLSSPLLTHSTAFQQAGKTRPVTSPNPIRELFPWHHPVIVTRSPSCKNVRFSPSGNVSGFVPFHASSSRLPYESGVGPLMVPDASRSPGRRLQPLTVWCASCWQTFQYRWRAFDPHIRCPPSL